MIVIRPLEVEKETPCTSINSLSCGKMNKMFQAPRHQTFYSKMLFIDGKMATGFMLVKVFICNSSDATRKIKSFL